jgi:hypothetical protein
VVATLEFAARREPVVAASMPKQSSPVGFDDTAGVKAFRLPPHWVEKFDLSTDPLFVNKLYDVVEFFLDPPAAVRELQGVGHAACSFGEGQRRRERLSNRGDDGHFPPRFMCRAPRSSTSSA